MYFECVFWATRRVGYETGNFPLETIDDRRGVKNISHTVMRGR